MVKAKRHGSGGNLMPARKDGSTGDTMLLSGTERRGALKSLAC